MRLLLTITLLLTSTAALAQASGKDLLEQRIQTKLDRILQPEEYLLDIKIQSKPGVNDASSNQFLPGLQVLGPLTEVNGESPTPIFLGGNADVLLLLDKKVSKERARVAQDIVNRIVESVGLKTSVKVSMQQKDINKIAPPEPVPPPPPKDPTFLDQVIREKEFVGRALLVFWVGLVSMIAVYFGLRRFLLSGAEGRAQNQPERSPAAPLQAPAPPAAKTERTREEIYSRDEAVLHTIKEITEEAREQPDKVARILSRWVSQGDDLAKAASLFLRNCEIKAVELVCKAMHPSDLEKIIAHKIEDFEPFGNENQRVIERMRADFAVLASEHFLRERPDPLGFLKRVSDDEIRNILDGESIETVALVATQIPAHRLQKFYDTTPPETMKAILACLSSLKSASVSDFEKLQMVLNNKMETLAGNLVSEKDKVHSMLQMITSVPSPVFQKELLGRLQSDSPASYAIVRSSILLATDLAYLPSRVRNMLIQSIDADTMGTAVSDFRNVFEPFLDGLPLTFQSVFNDAVSRTYEVTVVNTAWRTISTTIAEMINAGLISKSEVVATIRRAETAGTQGEGSDKESSEPTDEEHRGAA